MRLLLALVVTLVCLIGASCGGGSSSSSGGSSGSVTLGLLVGDAPTDTLSSATITVTEFRLLRAAGGATENLLGAPRTLDVLGLGLEGQEALLDYVNGDQGDYVGLRASIDPATIELRDLDGVLVPVQVISSEADSLFSTSASGALSLSKGDFSGLSLDIDLDASLSDNGVGFDFALNTNSAHSNSSSTLDELDGQVTSINRSSKWFEVRIVDARSQSTVYGELRVFVEDNDLLYNSNGAIFGNSNAFLAALQVDDYVEVAGQLIQNGNFDASRCEIEDGSRSQVRMEGRILSVDEMNQTFEIRLEEIEKGYSIARPVLSALGDPGVLQIAWDDRTLFQSDSDRDNGLASPADLVPGKEVDVRIDAVNFNAPMPFLARSVRVDLDTQYEGSVSAIDGLPNSFMLTMDNSSPAVTSGRVTGPVEVNLDSAAEVFLDVDLEPGLDTDQVLVGLRVKVSGLLTGPSGGAQLSANRVRVEPGRLQAIVDSFADTGTRMTIIISRLDDPFGDPVPNMTADLIVPVDALIELDGDAVSYNALRAAFNSRAEGEFMELEVEGIGDGSGDITAYEIEAEFGD